MSCELKLVLAMDRLACPSLDLVDILKKKEFYHRYLFFNKMKSQKHGIEMLELHCYRRWPNLLKENRTISFTNNLSYKCGKRYNPTTLVMILQIIHQLPHIKKPLDSTQFVGKGLWTLQHYHLVLHNFIA